MNIQIDGWICRRQWEWQKDEEATWEFHPGVEGPKGVEYLIPVQRHTIVAEVPDDRFIPQRVKALEDAITQLYIDTQRQVTQLQERKANLLALTNEVKA